jgi:hypothetical protein
LLEQSTALGVEIATFKGLAIGRRWYPRPELRPAVDVDIFTNPSRPEHLAALVEALTGDARRGSAVNAMVSERRVFEIPLVVDGVAFDLHLDPMNMIVPMRNRQLAWERTEQMPIGEGQAVRVLDLETSLLQALLHLFRDNFADLLHIADIGLMMDQDPDWDFVERTAALEGWTDIVRDSLGFSCHILGRESPLPRTLSAANRALISAIWPHRIRFEGAASLGRSDRRQSLASLLIRNRRLDVTRALARRTFPSRMVIEDRFENAGGSYPIALYRWRRSQRAEILRFREAAARTPVRRISVLGGDTGDAFETDSHAHG